ncbi:MAG: methionyl-tRNA formyltransferase [Actinomycetota bacterium]
MSLEVVFFGTPPAAVPTLRALGSSPHRVSAVVTGPDRPSGRGMRPGHSAVKAEALEARIPVLQPKTLRAPAGREQIEMTGGDVFVVVAYGLILPEEVLKTPRLGCVNVHFSLLPKLRGAAPVQWALIEGHSETGVTIMQMDAGMDTGPIISQTVEPVTEADTAGSLEARLADLGAPLLLQALDEMESGEARPVPQDDSRATYAPKINPEDARLDWSRPAEELARRVRAFDPRPGAWTQFRSKRLKVYGARRRPGEGEEPGRVVVEGAELSVQASDGRLVLFEVQPEGRRRMTGEEFVRGYRPDGELLE